MRALKKKEITFLQKYRAKPLLSERTAHRLALALPFALILALAGGGYGLLCYQAHLLEQEAIPVIQYLGDEERQEVYQRVQRLTQLKAQFTAKRDDLLLGWQAIGSYPALDQNLVITVLEEAGPVTIESWQYSDAEGALTLRCYGNGVGGAPDFADRLAATGLFAQVGYWGYAGDSREGRYDFTVQCSLQGGQNPTFGEEE